MGCRRNSWSDKEVRIRRFPEADLYAKKNPLIRRTGCRKICREDHRASCSLYRQQEGSGRLILFIGFGHGDYRWFSRTWDGFFQGTWTLDRFFELDLDFGLVFLRIGLDLNLVFLRIGLDFGLFGSWILNSGFSKDRFGFRFVFRLDIGDSGRQK